MKRLVLFALGGWGLWTFLSGSILVQRGQQWLQEYMAHRGTQRAARARWAEEMAEMEEGIRGLEVPSSWHIQLGP